MATLTFKVEDGAPLAMKRSELVLFALHEHPDASGVVFLNQGHVICRGCVEGGDWLLDLDGDLDALDDRALVLFSTVACSVCDSGGQAEGGDD